jgi:hypothetical protein
MTTVTDNSNEIDQIRKNLPQLKIQSATAHFLTATYEKTPHRRIKTTLTFPQGYPDQHALIVEISSVPPGLKKKLEKELGDVAQQGKQQVEAVLTQLINFVDTNKFVPCWKELRQVVDMVQNKSAQTPQGKGSTIAIHDTKGLIKLRLQGSQYYYSCIITVDDGYPSTMTHQDWGKACKLVVNSTNFPSKIEQLMTTQAKELVRRMQDGMSPGNALKMSNPIRAPQDSKKDTTKQGKKITQSEALASNSNNKDLSSEWQIEEKARMAGYGIPSFDESNPQPSLLTLVTFLMEKIQHLPEETCPICKELSLSTDPTILKALYANNSTSATTTEQAKKACRIARQKRPIRTYCGCWYHYSCLDKYIREPPFGASCPVDSCRVYHPDWPTDVSDLERTWNAKEARRREIEDAAMCFL